MISARAEDELILLVDKPRRLSPVQAIERARALDPALKDRSIGYAGRLDPLATGLLVLLLDERNKSAHEFNHLDKRYEVEVVFGVRTDSFDLLGLAERVELGALDGDGDGAVRAMIEARVRALEGTRMQQYPPWSSVRVRGRPAFYWAHRGLVPEGGWPERERTVHAATVLSRAAIDGEALIDRAIEDVREVSGAFRQEQLVERWTSLRPLMAGRSLPVVRIAVECSSGTFMRSLANLLGESMGTGAVATVIHRTRVGPFQLREARSL
jgi:tRNA pseudouridine55 synthase